MPKRYLGSRSDKAIDYTVRKYCTCSIGLQHLCVLQIIYTPTRSSVIGHRPPIHQFPESSWKMFESFEVKNWKMKNEIHHVRWPQVLNFLLRYLLLVQIICRLFSELQAAFNNVVRCVNYHVFLYSFKREDWKHVKKLSKFWLGQQPRLPLCEELY